MVPHPDVCGMPFVRYTRTCVPQLERALRKAFQDSGLTPPSRTNTVKVEEGDLTPEWMRFLVRLDEEDQRLLRGNPGLQVSSFATNAVESRFSFTTQMTITQMSLRRQQLDQEEDDASTRTTIDQENAQRRAARTRPYVGGASWGKPAALGRWYANHQAVSVSSGPLSGVTSAGSLHKGLIEATPAVREEFLRHYGVLLSFDGGVQCKLHGKGIELTEERRQVLLRLMGQVAGDLSPEAAAQVTQEDPFNPQMWNNWCRAAFDSDTFTLSEKDVKRHTCDDRQRRADRKFREECGLVQVFTDLSGASIRTQGPVPYAAILRANWDHVQNYAHDRRRRRWRFLAHSKKRSHLAQTAKRVVRFGTTIAGGKPEDDSPGPRVLIALGDGIFPPGGFGHETRTSHRQYAECIAKMFPRVRFYRMIVSYFPSCFRRRRADSDYYPSL